MYMNAPESAAELDSLCSQDLKTLVEAMCRAGLLNQPELSPEAAAATGPYFETISQRFVAPVLAAAQVCVAVHQHAAAAATAAG